MKPLTKEVLADILKKLNVTDPSRVRKLNAVEMSMLKPYETELVCASERYLRSPGRAAVEKIKRVYTRLYGTEWTRSDSCGHCELDLLRAVAPAYFVTKQPEE